MRFEPNDEQRQVQAVVRDLARSRVLPRAGAWDEAGAFPAATWDELAQLGLTGVDVPEGQGGAGLDVVTATLALEELAAASGSLAWSLANHLVAGFALRSATEGSAEARALAGGEVRGATLASPALTGGLATEAPERFSGDVRHVGQVQGAQRFVLPVDGDGLAVFEAASLEGRADAHPLGLRAAGLGTLSARSAACVERFDHWSTGARAATRDYARLLNSAVLVGLGRMALDEASRYALERKAFGQPIGELQSIQHKLADAATLLDAARLSTWRAAAKLDGGRTATREVGVARLMAARAALLATDEGLQIFGGYGYTEDFPVERAWRDAKVVSVDEGATDAQRADLARETYRLIA